MEFNLEDLIVMYVLFGKASILENGKFIGFEEDN